MDAVCSVASEEIRMDAWGLDVVLSASQKGLGAPPGLSIVAASQKAMEVSTLLQISARNLLTVNRSPPNGRPQSHPTTQVGKSECQPHVSPLAP